MTFWAGVAIFLAIIVVLTWVGAKLVARNPDTKWERDEDKPYIGHDV